MWVLTVSTHPLLCAGYEEGPFVSQEYDRPHCVRHAALDSVRELERRMLISTAERLLTRYTIFHLRQACDSETRRLAFHQHSLNYLNWYNCDIMRTAGGWRARWRWVTACLRARQLTSALSDSSN